MPNIHVDLASALLTSRYGRKFGHLVRVIGGADFIALTQIESRLEAYQGDTEIRIRRGEVEPMMALLIWHKYATFKQSNGKAVYKLGMDEILRISHYPRYMYHICELFDDRGRCMIEDILLHGRLEQGAIVRNQIRREFGDKATHDPSVVSLVLETFKTMVGTTFLVREPNLSDADSDIPSFNACDELEKYQVNSELGEEKVEERKIEYWTINGDRFENYIRDQIMVDDAAEHCGQLASHVLRNTLRISEHGLARLTEPEYAVSYKQIEHACKEAHIVTGDWQFLKARTKSIQKNLKT